MSTHGTSPARERNSSTGFETISQEPSRRNLGSLDHHKEPLPLSTISTHGISPAHKRNTPSQSGLVNSKTRIANNVVIPTVELSPAQQQCWTLCSRTSMRRSLTSVPIRRPPWSAPMTTRHAPIDTINLISDALLQADKHLKIMNTAPSQKEAVLNLPQAFALLLISPATTLEAQ
jgi:hypothetical protein